MIVARISTPYDRLMAHFLAEVGCAMGADAEADEICFHARIRWHEFLGQMASADVDRFYAASDAPSFRH